MFITLQAKMEGRPFRWRGPNHLFLPPVQEQVCRGEVVLVVVEVIEVVVVVEVVEVVSVVFLASYDALE